MRAIVVGMVAYFSFAGIAIADFAPDPSLFNESEFKPFKGNGPANVEGEAFIRTKGGENRNCQAETVYLAPATSYDKAAVNKLGFNLRAAMDFAGLAAPFWRKSTCNSQGKFVFKKIPSGDYFAITNVEWRAREGRRDEKQGGTLVQKVTITDGDNSLILTDKDQAGWGGWSFK